MDKKIPRDVLFKLIEAVSAISCSLLQLTIITGAFSRSDVGLLAFASTYVYFLSCFTLSHGILNIVSRDIAQHKREVSVVSNGVLAQSLGVAFTVFIPLPLLFLTTYPLEIKVTVLCAFFPVMVGIVIGMPQAVLAGKEQIVKHSIASILANAATFLGVLISVSLGASLPLIAAVSGSNFLLASLFSYWFAPIHRSFDTSAVSMKDLRAMIRQSLPGVITATAVNLYIRIDNIMIEYFLGTKELGGYSGAYAVLNNLMILSGAIMAAVCPTMLRLTAEDPDRLGAFYRGTIRIGGYFFFPVAVFIAFFADPILLNLFGQEYTSSSTTLSVLMLAAIFAWLNGPSVAIFLAYHKQHLYMYITILGALINIVGNYFLIPLLGADGAAWATALTELSLCALSIAFMARVLGHSPLRQLPRKSAT